MAQTLEQQRAAFAWESAQKGVGDFGKEYVNVAKSTPTLIMNSGLMQTLAFLQSKGSVDRQMMTDLAAWLLKTTLKGKPVRDFSTLMTTLQTLDPRLYRDTTTETLALLRWLRQMAPAVSV